MGIVSAEVARHGRATRDDPATALVWIDAREAAIVRLAHHEASIERLRSDVPAHHRSTRHVRHDPAMRHGGGGEAASGEPRRLEHLELFCKRVAERIPPTHDVVVMGPGMVRHHLEARLRAAGGPGGRRRIEQLPAGRMTDGQLVAWLRRHVDDEPRRTTVGAYRWTSAPTTEASGHRVFEPRRTFEKRSREVHGGSA